MLSVSSIQSKRPAWQTIIIFTLAFWLSSSLLLDMVIMPGLYASGMMAGSGFATAGYLIFWIFNRIELVCAALVLTGTFALAHTESQTEKSRPTAIILSIILLVVALVYTYALTPQMSALGLNLNLFEPAVEVPSTMNLLHSGYWILEVIKLVAGGAVIRWCYGRS